MKLKEYMNEGKDAEYYRKIVLDWFTKVKHTKKNIKRMHDMIWFVNIYKKNGKVKVDYKDNKSGNVVPYVGSKSIATDSINTAEDIGLEDIFKG